MEKIAVNIKGEVLVDTNVIKPDGYSKIEIMNVGDDTVLILGVYELTKNDPPLKFKVPMTHSIITNIPIVFSNLSLNKKIIIFKYY